ncbi:CDP-alcohol phosphatidyltransferase family protein [Mesorhizobium sp. KR1-2]|uniref:CDP-alcohol phosphatidyltransferase family protein n=1 Tax=Mesorhizobium sp. KR1-2 TaxID=3156609 RepID=UPI0032B4E52D
MVNLYKIRNNYELLIHAQKRSDGGAPIYTRRVNRFFGRFLAALLAETQLTPNAVSIMSIALTLTGLVGLIALKPSIPVALLVTLLLLAGYALDSSDGQLARLRGAQCPRGEWLDHVIDAFKMVAVHWSALIFLLKNVEENYILIFSTVFIFQSFSSVIYFSGILKSKIRTPDRGSGDGLKVVEPSFVRDTALIFLDYGVLCMIFVFSFNPNLFIICYVILMLLFVTFSIYSLVKAFLSMPGPVYSLNGREGV